MPWLGPWREQTLSSSATPRSTTTAPTVEQVSVLLVKQGLYSSSSLVKGLDNIDLRMMCKMHIKAHIYLLTDFLSNFSEAEYAFTLKKPMIPLKMERNYQAREWLGFILGSKLFFEFTDKYPFESKMSALIKEVLTRQKKSVPDKPIISHTAPVTTEVKRAFISLIPEFSIHA